MAISPIEKTITERLHQEVFEGTTYYFFDIAFNNRGFVELDVLDHGKINLDIAAFKALLDFLFSDEVVQAVKERYEGETK